MRDTHRSCLGGYFFYGKYFIETPPGEIHTETVDGVQLSGSDYRLINRINHTRTPEFYTSAAKVKNDFNRARRLIKTGKYNEAAYVLNGIYNSNATFSVREKCDFLIRFIMDVDHRSYAEILPAKILKKPYLYRGFGLRLLGKVTNLKKLPGSTSFTLLVNYRRKDIFDGVADVFQKGRNDNLVNGAMVTVDGLFVSPISKNGRLVITARDIRK